MSFIDEIKKLNPTRAEQSQLRRQLKLLEEVGELAEAYGHFTHPQNPKGKTVEDVTEELIDVAIMAYDLALTGHDFVMFPYDPDTRTALWRGDATLGDLKKLVGAVIFSQDPAVYSLKAEELGHTAYGAAIGLVGLEAAAMMFNRKIAKWRSQVAKGEDLCSRTATE